jgi:low affinity Fe/Cu permease
LQADPEHASARQRSGKAEAEGVPMRVLFDRIANHIARQTGRPGAFILATLIVLVWAFTGPLFGFSDTWQLVINTSTTIVTFLMVFLIQSTQNRDTAAIQIKLDELIRATEGAHNALLDLEELSERELERIRQRYEELAAAARAAARRGDEDTNKPNVQLYD